MTMSNNIFLQKMFWLRFQLIQINLIIDTLLLLAIIFCNMNYSKYHSSDEQFWTNIELVAFVTSVLANIMGQNI